MEGGMDEESTLALSSFHLAAFDGVGSFHSSNSEKQELES